MLYIETNLVGELLEDKTSQILINDQLVCKLSNTPIHGSHYLSDDYDGFIFEMSVDYYMMHCAHVLMMYYK